MNKNIDNLWSSPELQEFTNLEKCSIGQVYEKAEKLSKKILDLFYEDHVKFPVNIRGIAKMFGLEMFETNLNVNMGFRVEKVNGYLHRKCDGGYTINLHIRDSEFSKRFFIAHVLSEYIMLHAGSLTQEEKEKKYAHNYADPLFSKDHGVIFADILSTFLMFPPELVLESLAKYSKLMKAHEEYPIMAFEWMQYLSQEAQVSFYYTASCYQHMKMYLCSLYNSDPQSKLIEKYSDFFK